MAVCCAGSSSSRTRRLRAVARLSRYRLSAICRSKCSGSFSSFGAGGPLHCIIRGYQYCSMFVFIVYCKRTCLFYRIQFPISTSRRFFVANGPWRTGPNVLHHTAFLRTRSKVVVLRKPPAVVCLVFNETCWGKQAGTLRCHRQRNPFQERYRLYLYTESPFRVGCLSAKYCISAYITHRTILCVERVYCWPSTGI